MSVVDSDAERQTEPVQIHWWSRSDREGIEATLTRTSGEHVFRPLSLGPAVVLVPHRPCRLYGGERGWEPSEEKALASARAAAVRLAGGGRLAIAAPVHGLASEKLSYLWWRSVGSTHTAYAVEAFLDEVAEAAGKDPVALRLELLKYHPRHAGVLRLAAEKAGWNRPLPKGRFRGVAVAEPFKTYVAQVAEVTVDDRGRPKVERIVCAIDCGVAVNPDIIRAQMEGGIGFGLGAVMKSQITIEGGAVQEGNFDGYDVLRLNEMPQVEVHIVPSSDRPTGVGEPGVPPIGPAVANAIYAATCKRMRILPFSRDQGT